MSVLHADDRVPSIVTGSSQSSRRRLKRTVRGWSVAEAVASHLGRCGDCSRLRRDSEKMRGWQLREARYARVTLLRWARSMRRWLLFIAGAPCSSRETIGLDAASCCTAGRQSSSVPARGPSCSVARSKLEATCPGSGTYRRRPARGRSLSGYSRSASRSCRSASWFCPRQSPICLATFSPRARLALTSPAA